MKSRTLERLPMVATALMLSWITLGVGKADASRLPPVHYSSEPPSQSGPDLRATGPSQELLKGVFEKSTQELEQARTLMNDGRYGDAMLAAKKIVDRVSVINPKGNFSTQIPVSGILSEADFRKTFGELRNNQQDKLAEAVTAFKGGYFLDILNLYKRAKLTYVEAFYKNMKAKSQLLHLDIEMMRQSLIDVYAISILVKDNNSPNTYLLFDSDIANPDEQYLFNRELISTALSIRELKFTEDSFIAAVKADMSRRVSDHVAGLVHIEPKKFNVCSCVYHPYEVSLYQQWTLEQHFGPYFGPFNDKDSCIRAETAYVNQGICSVGTDL